MTSLAYPLRIVLSLLIAVTQAVAVRGASDANASRRAPITCCCIGECHCTGDCCNHGPAKHGAERTPGIRPDPGPPLWRAPERCGVIEGTFQRAPGNDEIAAVRDRCRLWPPTPDARWRGDRSAARVSRHEELQPLSPRAPPRSVSFA